MAVAFPYPPALDMEWTNPETGKLYRYDGESWRLIVQDLIGGCATPDSTICDKINEIEEEFENLLPTIDRGRWFYSQDFAKGPGKFGLRTAQGGIPTSWSDAEVLIFNKEDADGNEHGFASLTVDSFIQVFREGIDDFAIYKITQIGDMQGDEWFQAVTHERSLGIPPEVGQYSRFKFYEVAGASNNAFVLLTGDTMTGDLVIGKDPDPADTGEASLRIQGRLTNSTSPAARIDFDNDVVADGSKTGSLTYRNYGSEQWFQFNKDVDLSGRGVHSVGTLRMNNLGYLQAGTNNRIRFRQDSSATSSEGYSAVRIESPGESKRAFAVRGRRANGAEGDLLWTDKDSAYYDGRVDSNTKIANKKYVDAAVKNAVDNIDTNGATDYVRTTTSSYNANIKLYKSNGVFYISGG